MDFLRPRAIPALIALALLPAAVHAACDTLQGTYQYYSGGKDREALSTFVDGPAKKKLFKSIGPSKPGGDLASTAPRARMKVEHLASTVALRPRGNGAELEFFDAKGASLARVALAPGFRCTGDKLARTEERLSGLGNAIREIKVEESFSRAPDGSLLRREVTTTVGAKTPPQTSEALFARVGK